MCADHTSFLAAIEASKLATPSVGVQSSSCESSSSNQSDSDASTLDLSSRSSSVSSRRSERSSASKPANNAANNSANAAENVHAIKNSVVVKVKSTNGKRQSLPPQGAVCVAKQNSKNATPAADTGKRVTRKASIRLDDSPMFDDKDDDCFPELVIDIPSI